MLNTMSNRARLLTGIAIIVSFVGAVFVGTSASNAKGHIQALQKKDLELANRIAQKDAGIARLESRLEELEALVPQSRDMADAPHRLDADQMRAFARVVAKRHLGYTDADFDQLDTNFTNFRKALGPSNPAEWSRTLSDAFIIRLEKPPALTATFYDRATRSKLPTDAELTPPTLEIHDGNSQNPAFTVSDVPDGAQIYLEIDSRPDFSGRNLVRFPSLAPLFVETDNAIRTSQTLQLFQARAEGWLDADRPFRLPMRVSSFALDPEGRPDFLDFALYSQLVTHGLDPDEAVVEAVEVVSRRIDHGGASTHRSPFETYVAGVDECGHVNELLGAILEMSGLRYRGVSGFNPWVKPLMPGAGHSAIEVEGPEDKWEYADAFVYYHTPGTSAAELAAKPGLGPALFKTPEGAKGSMGLDDDVNISDLFRYRRYFDKSNRQRVTSAIELMGEEDSYGRDFVARPLTDQERFDPSVDVPDTQTLHIRARYVVSELCEVRLREGCSDLNAVASPWTTQTLVTYPRRLLAGSL